VLGRLSGLFSTDEPITDEFWEELEEILILADVGMPTTMALVDRLQDHVRQGGIRSAAQARELLKQEMITLLDHQVPRQTDEKRLLTVILVVGANGSGKTTSIAKVTHYYQQQGRRVMLCAADTFRAAAIDQLRIWGERLDAPVIAHQPGADAGAVVYDAIRASQSRGMDLLIIDTAGRLHTHYNLMQELAKVRGVAAKQVHRAPHETLLVLDATTGQNGLAQARHFKETVEVSGIILAKLDGTAKGGVVFAIARELNLPIRFVGTGEEMEDLVEFDATTFVEGLFLW
jgi:fused signal recognition particle receptor